MSNNIFGLTVKDTIEYLCPSSFVVVKEYKTGLAFGLGDEVRYQGQYYSSLIDNNLFPPEPMKNPAVWSPIAGEGRVNAQQVGVAMQQACSMVSPALIPTTGQENIDQSCYPAPTITGYTNLQIAFLSLVAHYLTEMLFSINNAGETLWQRSGQSVSSVSATYSIPPKLTESFGLALLSTTNYGKSYIATIAPLLRVRTTPWFAPDDTDGFKEDGCFAGLSKPLDRSK